MINEAFSVNHIESRYFETREFSERGDEVRIREIYALLSPLREPLPPRPLERGGYRRVGHVDVRPQALLVSIDCSDIRTCAAIAKARPHSRRWQGILSQELRHQKEHEIREAVEKKDQPELKTAGLFRRSVLRMKMRLEVRRAMRGHQTAAAIETTLG